MRIKIELDITRDELQDLRHSESGVPFIVKYILGLSLHDDIIISNVVNVDKV